MTKTIGLGNIPMHFQMTRKLIRHSLITSNNVRRFSMAFVTGLLLIDAPASALNNLGSIPGERVDNTSGVKVIRTREGMFPYVSAQAFRYWLRTTAQARIEGWRAAPIYREEKIAYTDSNPINWWDDDLLEHRSSSREEGLTGKEQHGLLKKN